MEFFKELFKKMTGRQTLVLGGILANWGLVAMGIFDIRVKRGDNCLGLTSSSDDIQDTDEE